MTNDRAGRPRKYAANRIRTGVRFRPEQHELLKSAAQAAGRSVSEEVEARIERLSAYEAALLDMKKIEQMSRSNLEGALRQAGWTSEINPDYGGRVWFPPGQFPLPQSGFIDRREEPRPTTIAMTAAVQEVLGQMVKEAVQEELASAAAETPLPAAVAMTKAAEDALGEIVKESVRKVVKEELSQVIKEELARAGVGEHERRKHHATGR